MYSTTSRGWRRNSYIKASLSTPAAKNTCLVFSLKNDTPGGALSQVLSIFGDRHKVDLAYIETRPSKRISGKHEFYVECNSSTGNLSKAVEELRPLCSYLYLISRNYNERAMTIPWFPRRIRELDRFANQIQDDVGDGDSEHPVFTDEAYRERSKYFEKLAFDYKQGQPLPHINYTASETKTWSEVFSNITKLHKTHACKEFNHAFPLLIENCGYAENQIPQMETVSTFLKDSTGFTLRPVGGLLSSRDFLAGLAFRVFYATQHIRHPSTSMFSPVPDVCHELLGHVPMLADPAFAQFCQEIGLASLGAPDEHVEKLALCFWYTVDFGLCRQDGELKAFGAGLLSSPGELEYCLSGEPELRSFDLTNCNTTGPTNKYQPLYYVSDSFEDAKEKVTNFANSIPRPFGVRYNPYTKSIEVLDTKNQLNTLMSTIQIDIGIIHDAILKFKM